MTPKERRRIADGAHDAALIFQALVSGDPEARKLYGSAWDSAKLTGMLEFDVVTAGDWVCSLKVPMEAFERYRGAALREYLETVMIKMWHQRDHNPRPVVMTPQRQSRTIEVPESHDWIANRRQERS